ncbi:glycosyltransferase [Glycomyces sp. NPDC048151]|uniref:glycosyltransferase n=1 Tax=Glycomyces sp. NPDC048151 TaxID=3364002 RepID=UPI0037212D69
MSAKRNFALPGKVLMLVDNHIDGDSRVQKTAKSMAEAGWEVHLVGRSPENKWEHYDLGGARVHRLPYRPIPPQLTLRKALANFRFPLAAKSIAIARRRLDLLVLDASELAQRRLEAGDPRIARRRFREPRLPLVLFRRVAGMRKRWLQMRLRQTETKLEWQRGRFKGALEEFEAAFWTLLLRDRAWRRLDVTPLNYDLSYGKFIDEAKPNLIHAHDMRMIGVAARAAARARVKGRRVKVIYDAHEFVPGLSHPGRKWLKSAIAYEREYFRFADAVFTVSPALADLLVDAHKLDERPEVTLNAPPKPTGAVREDAAAFGDVRAACGLGPDVPLMVYCGGAAPQRGLHTMVEALAFQPKLHAAFVINRLEGPYIDLLREKAEEVGASDRIHLMPYVPYDVLVGFLSTADVGIHPLVTGPVNHEVALSTKFFEFMQAGLPMVVSNVKAMSTEVRRLGMGEVFESEDGKDLARAVGAVLGARETYTRAYLDKERLDEYTWEAQAAKYVQVYRRLLLKGGGQDAAR